MLIIAIGAYLLWASLSHRHNAVPKGRSLALASGMIPCPLTTFVLSHALPGGVLASGLLVTAAMAVGMITTVGGVALVTTVARGRLVGLLARSESWRHRAGTALEVEGATLVLLLGISTFLRSISTQNDPSMRSAFCTKRTMLVAALMLATDPKQTSVGA